MSSERKHLPMYTIDAFASKPFKGNPAAVCLLQDEAHTVTGELGLVHEDYERIGEQDLSDETKQNIAMEMNLSETAFLRPVNAGDSFEKSSRFGLRWFTPKNEVNLCGHATLASAAALFTCKGNPSTSLTFLTKSGELVAKRKGDLVCIDLPLNPPSDKIPYGVDKLIEITLEQFETKKEVVLLYSPETKKLLICLHSSMSRQEFEHMSPNPSAMMNAYKTGEVMGVILTLKGSKENGAVDEDGRMFDFISRYFAPWNGIDEDPVTGAAHTVLSAYWSKVLGKTEMYARQCSKRGGNIEIKVRDDGRVELAGKARTVLEGKIFVD